MAVKMEKIRIAVLITCHNRKYKTLACIEAIFKQILSEAVSLHVYLVDDGSTDGTAEAVEQRYPQIKILQGDGNLYWNGGMRVAFGEALKSDFDYYLWLNDDTILSPEAIARLLRTYHQLKEQGDTLRIVVGATCDPHTGEPTYGGLVRKSKWHPLKFKVLQAREQPTRCDTMSGNCVLVPRTVAQEIGNLDPSFTHSKGDWDYGLRLQKKGGSVWLAPGYLATCEEHPPNTNCWDNPDLTLRERVKMVLAPKFLPMGEWRVLLQRHTGLLWPFYWVSPYLRLLWRAAYFKLQKIKKKILKQENTSFG